MAAPGRGLVAGAAPGSGDDLPLQHPRSKCAAIARPPRTGVGPGLRQGSDRALAGLRCPRRHRKRAVRDRPGSLGYDPGRAAETTANLARPGAQAGLAVWQDEDGRDPQAALALGDGRLRIWDSGQDRWHEQEDGRFNVAAAFLPGLGRLVTGSVGKSDGRLQVWDPQQRPFVPKQSVSFPPEKDNDVFHFFFPRALTPLFVGEGNQASSLAAAFLVAGKDEVSMRLRVLDMTKEVPEIVRKLRLWNGLAGEPVLAASPDGKFLAVTGGPGNALLLYRTAELLAAGGEPQPQVIRSRGITVRSVCFVNKGDAVSLLLGAAAKPAPGPAPWKPQDSDLLFDVGRRALTGDHQGWRPSVPNLGGWEAHLVSGQKGTGQETIEVREEGRAYPAVSVKGRVTDYALFPPRPPLNVALLAVASLDRFYQPNLALYNASTGQQLRQWIGHNAAITCLAFATDGRLLASAADDQTVSVWNLRDLPKLVGQHADLHGLAIREQASPKGPEVVVAEVAGEGPLHGLLAKGDVLEGLATGAILQRFTSARAYHEALWQRKPGSKAFLQIRGRQPGVAVTLNQVIDEGKPLFSLFITEADAAGERDWIAWSPTGPYDASGRRAERSLGWQLGTDRPERPTSFVLADRYHKEFYREGMVERLLRTGDVGQAPPPPALQPRMSVWIESGSGPAEHDAQGDWLLARREAVLKLAVSSCSPDQVRRVLWQLDGGGAQPLRTEGGMEWSADLASALGKLGWRRVSHTVRVLLETNEEASQLFPRELTFLYRPAAPQLAIESPQRLSVTRPVALAALTAGEGTLSLKGTVGPGPAGEKVIVRLTQRHGNQDVIPSREWTIGAATALAEKFQLKVGQNRIEILARNESAAEGREECRLVLEVAFQPGTALQVATRAVVPLVGAERDPLPVEPGRPVILRVPRARIVGTVLASEPLVRAEWGPMVDGRPGKAQALTGSLAKERPIAETIDLQAGKQAFFFAPRPWREKRRSRSYGWTTDPQRRRWS